MNWMSWLVIGSKFLYFILLALGIALGLIKFRGSLMWPPENLVAAEMRYSTTFWLVFMTLADTIIYLFVFSGLDLIKASFVLGNIVPLTLLEFAIPLLILTANKIVPGSRFIWGFDGVYCIGVPIFLVIASL